MKKVKQVLKILILAILILLFSNKLTFAAIGMDDVIQQGDKFINSGTVQTPVTEDKIKPISDSIYNILLIIGVAVASIVFIILGIKFMVGSVEEKADIKKQLITFVVGCVVIFGAFGIWKLVVTVLQSIH